MKDVSLILHYLDPASDRGTLLLTEDVDRISPSRILDVSGNRKNKAAIYMKIYLA